MSERRNQIHISPTSADVARKAGASRTAVSYVLNGVHSDHVSQEMRERILEAARELGYQPHASARALRKGQSEEISMIIDAMITPFGFEILRSMQQQSLRYGYTLVMYQSQGLSREQRREVHLKIFARRPLGIITSPLHFGTEEVELARKMGVPHILFISFQPEPIEGTYTIAFPSQAAGYLAARHLLERGHRHLALIQPEDPIQELACAQRLEGMRQAIAEFEPAAISLDMLPLYLSLSDARRLAETYFTQPDHATGVYAFSDDYALPLISALSSKSMRIPQDIAIVGTDDLPTSEFTLPPLTSIRFDEIDMGKRAIEMLDLLHKGLPLSEAYTRPLVPELIQRAST